MRNKDYYKYWINLIERFFENSDSLTKEDFLKLQQIIEAGYKLDDKVNRMKQIDLIFKTHQTDKDFDERIKFLFTDEEIEEYKKLKGL